MEMLNSCINMSTRSQAVASKAEHTASQHL